MIFILTGAGISQESGLGIFRGAGGLWEGQRIEDVATYEGFRRAPEQVHTFYNDLRHRLLSGDILHNPAHMAIARLAAEAKEEVVLVTQNVDDLHERAGSKNVLHMHGELFKVYCMWCESSMFWDKDSTTASRCAVCGREGFIRPHIVWFGEVPLCMEEIDEALSYCRLFVAIGTSGTVQPAASFAAKAKERGAYTLELNLEPSATASDFDECIYGQASVIVPAWVKAIQGVCRSVER